MPKPEHPLVWCGDCSSCGKTFQANGLLAALYKSGHCPPLCGPCEERERTRFFKIGKP